MAYHRPITEEMYQKMSDLRDQGLSNSQIALDLGVCYQSVRRFLGKQPEMLRVPYGSLKSHATGEKFMHEEPKPQTDVSERQFAPTPAIKLVSSVTTFQGGMFTYKIDIERDIVHLSDNRGGTAFELTMEQFRLFLAEMNELSAFLNDSKIA